MSDLRILFFLLASFVVSPVASSFLDNVMGDDEASVKLTSDGPAVLDSPLSVSAKLLNVDVEEGPFYFVFADDASPMHYKEIQTDGLLANFTVTYPSASYEPQTYAMTVRAYKMFAVFRTEIAQSAVRYRITKSLNGRLVAEQRNVTVAERDGVATVAVGAPAARFFVRLHDPSGFVGRAGISCYWFVNQTNYGSTTNGTPPFSYDFEKVGESSVEVLVLAKLSEDGEAKVPEDVHRRVTESKTPAEAQAAVATEAAVKSGLFPLRVNARRPMTSVSVRGERWLKHGELLNLTVTCDGSGPWTYCWSIKDSSYNMTGNETCDVFSEASASNCSFEVVWYLRAAGESAVLIVVDNVLDHAIKLVGINVYDVPRRIPVSLIVIPLCSALVAVIACISGFFVFLTFKRNMAGLETADFDFSCPDEQLEFKTFWERLRDSMLNALSNANKDDVSHVSSVSSRSVQGPPVGIHYGSIT